MTRRKIVNKVKKKDDLDPTKDEFLDKTNFAFDWLYKKRRLVGIVIAVVLVISIAGIIISNVQDAGEADESAVLDEVLNVIFASITDSGDFSAETDKDKDDELTFASIKVRAEKASDKYKKKKDKMSGEIALLANLYQARSSFELGKFKDAVSHYEKFLNSKDSENNLMYPIAVEGMAYALYSDGQKNKAKKILSDLEKKSRGESSHLVRYHLATIFAEEGEKEKAAKYLMGIVGDIADENPKKKLDYLYNNSREQLLAINPEADVPVWEGAGLQDIDPEILQMLMNKRMGGEIN